MFHVEGNCLQHYFFKLLALTVKKQTFCTQLEPSILRRVINKIVF